MCETDPTTPPQETDSTTPPGAVKVEVSSLPNEAFLRSVPGEEPVLADRTHFNEDGNTAFVFRTPADLRAFEEFLEETSPPE